MKINIFRWIKQSFFKKILKNTTTLLTGSFISSTLGLVSFTIILRSLGPDLYGQFVIMQTYMELFDQLFNFQCWHAMIKFGSDAIVENNYRKIKRIIKLGSAFDLFSAFLGMASAVLLVFIVGDYLAWTDRQIEFARLFSFLIILNITGSPIGILRLYRKFKYLSFHRILNGILKLIVVSVFSAIGFNGYEFFYVLFFIQLIDQSSLIVIALIVLKRLKLLSFYKEKITEWKEFVTFAAWTNLDSTLNIPVKKLDKIFISKFLSYEAVAAYKLFNQLSFIIRKIVNSIYYSIFPELSELVAKGEVKKALKEGVKIGILVVAIGVPFYLIFVVLSYWFTGPVFGVEYIKYWPLMILYVGYNLLFVLFISIDPIFISLGHVRYRFFITIVANVVYLILIYLIQDKMGLFGFILAEIIQNVFLYGLKISSLYKKEIR